VPDLDSHYAAVSDHVLQAVAMMRAQFDCDFSEALGRLRENFGATVVVVTHSLRVAAAADRVVEMRDGCVR